MLPLLIEPADLQACPNIPSNDLVIVDVGNDARYLAEHIPGAVLVTPAETQAGPPVPGLIPSDKALTVLMRRIGLTENTHVVVYDDEGGGWAGRFIWMLDEIGHTRYSYLNGGLIAWKAEGYPTEHSDISVEPSNISVKANHLHTVDIQTLFNAIGDESTQIWDARSPMEFSGQTQYAARAGHIPGAVNYEWTRAMDPQNHYRLRPLAKVENELVALGITPDKHIITHCQSHHRSGFTYLLAKLLNYPHIKAYAGSWGEWGNYQDTPIAP